MRQSMMNLCLIFDCGYMYNDTPYSHRPGLIVIMLEQVYALYTDASHNSLSKHVTVCFWKVLCDIVWYFPHVGGHAFDAQHKQKLFQSKLGSCSKTHKS